MSSVDKLDPSVVQAIENDPALVVGYRQALEDFRQRAAAAPAGRAGSATRERLRLELHAAKKQATDQALTRQGLNPNDYDIKQGDNGSFQLDERGFFDKHGVTIGKAATIGSIALGGGLLAAPLLAGGSSAAGGASAATGGTAAGGAGGAAAGIGTGVATAVPTGTGIATGVGTGIGTGVGTGAAVGGSTLMGTLLKYGIPVGADLLQSALSSRAEKNAAQQQMAGAERARADLSPYNQLGLQSANTLAGLLGLPGIQLPGGQSQMAQMGLHPLESVNRGVPSTMIGTTTTPPTVNRRGATLASVRSAPMGAQISSYRGA